MGPSTCSCRSTTSTTDRYPDQCEPIDLPAAWKGAQRGARLRLGDFAGAVRVQVNGRPVPVSAVSGGHSVDVTDRLRVGTDTIVVKLSTTLNNAMRTTTQAGIPGYSNFASRPELPAVLLGPVQLVPYGQAPVPVAGRASVTRLDAVPGKAETGKRAEMLVTVTGTGNPPSAKPDGKVRYYVDGEVRGTKQLSSEGKLTVRLPKIETGNHTVQAAYLGSGTTEASASAVVRLTVADER